MPPFAENLRRLMARGGLTIEQVHQRSGLDRRTVKGLLSGRGGKPHARTLHQLATGLAVPADELFTTEPLAAKRAFDRHTNRAVDEVLSTHAELFVGWTAPDFDELYSRFGTGGELTTEGALDAAREMNRKRQIHEKLSLLLETGEADVISGIVELMYERVKVQAPAAYVAHGPRPCESGSR